MPLNEFAMRGVIKSKVSKARQVNVLSMLKIDLAWEMWSKVMLPELENQGLIQGAYYTGCQVNPPDHPERICRSFFSRIVYLRRSRLRLCVPPTRPLSWHQTPNPGEKEIRREEEEAKEERSICDRDPKSIWRERLSKVRFSGFEISMCDRGPKSIWPVRGDQTLCSRSSNFAWEGWWTNRCSEL